MSLKEKFAFLKWLDPFTYVDLYVLPRVNPHNISWINSVCYFVFAFIFAFILYQLLGILLGTKFPLVIVVSGSMEPVYHRGDIIILQGANSKTLNAPSIELPRSTLKGVPVTDFAIQQCTLPNSDTLRSCSEFREKLFMGELKLTDFTTKAIFFPDINYTLNLQPTGDIIVYFSNVQNKPIIHRAVVKLKTVDGWYILSKGDSEKNPLIDQDNGIHRGAVPLADLQGKSAFMIPLIGYSKLILVDDVIVLLTGCPNPEGCPFP